MKTRIPFREGLFELNSETPGLIGSRCKHCRQIVFPGRVSCLNCLGSDMEKVYLSRQGKLYTYTIVHMTSEHFPAPYAIGWIELPEGMRIFSQIRGWQERPLKIGMDMELTFEKLWDTEETEVIGYVFRPCSSD